MTGISTGGTLNSPTVSVLRCGQIAMRAVRYGEWKDRL